jgi:hypothetical protein
MEEGLTSQNFFVRPAFETVLARPPSATSGQICQGKPLNEPKWFATKLETRGKSDIPLPDGKKCHWLGLPEDEHSAP